MASSPAVPRPFGWRARAIVAARAAEHRARSAYLRLLPTPVLAAVDPTVRRVVRAARCAVAVPLHLHQTLALWMGTCDGRATRVAVWSKPDSPPPVLLEVLFDTPPAVAIRGGAGLTQMLRHQDLDADLVIAETTPGLAPLFRRRGFHIVPVAPWFMAATADVLAAVAAPTRSLRSDLKLVRTQGWRADLRRPSPALVRTFHDRYYLPHALSRFDDAAQVPSPAWLERHAAAGAFLLLQRPHRPEPEVMGLVIPRGRRFWLSKLGTLDADPAMLRAGGLAALYLRFAELARDRAVPWLDVGGSRPWRHDGVVRFKWKWGYRPTVDDTQAVEHAVRPLRPGSPAAARLAAYGVLVRRGREIRMLGPDGVAADGR